MARVRADKLREAHAGHDGTWIAHPGLATIAREAFDAVMTGTQPARRAARGRARHAARPAAGAGGRDHRGRAAQLHPCRRAVPRSLAARQRLRAALSPDGGRGHRRDLPRAAVAMAASRCAHQRWRCRCTVERFDASAERRSSTASTTRSARRALLSGVFPSAARLFEQMIKQRAVRRVPDPARLRAAELSGRRERPER